MQETESDMHRTVADNTVRMSELRRNKNNLSHVYESLTSDCPKPQEQATCVWRKSCVRKQTMLVILCFVALLAVGECQHRRRVNFCGRQLVEKLLKHCYPRGIHGSKSYILETKYGSRQRYTRSIVRECCREVCTPEKLEKYCERSPRENRFLRQKIRPSTLNPTSTVSMEPTITSPVSTTTIRTTTSLHLIRAMYQDDINEASAALQPALKVVPVKLNVAVKDHRRLLQIPAEDLPRPDRSKGSREASGNRHDMGVLQARLIAERDTAGYTRDKYA